MSIEARQTALKQYLSKNEIVIDPSNFVLPTTKDFHSTELTRDYEKLNSDNKNNVAEYLYFLEKPYSDVPGYYSEDEIIIVRGKPSLSNIHLGSYDADTLYFPVEDIRDNNAVIIHNNGQFFIKDYLQYASGNFGNFSNIGVRFVGINAPEVTKYKIIDKPNGKDIHNLTISDINNKINDNIEINFDTMSSDFQNALENANNTVPFIIVDNIFCQIVPYDSVIQIYEYNTDLLNTEKVEYYDKYAYVYSTAPEKDNLNCRNITNTLVELLQSTSKDEDGNTIATTKEVVMMLDHNMLNRKMSYNIYDDYGEGLAEIVEKISSLFKEKDATIYKDFSGYGQDAYGRFLGCLYVKTKLPVIDGIINKDVSDALGEQWINVTKFLLYLYGANGKISGDANLLPLSFNPDNPLYESAHNFASSAFKLWTYDRKKYVVMEELDNMSYDSIAKQRSLQRQILGFDFDTQLKDWTMMIGDCAFLVPPTSIRCVTRNGLETVPLLRSKGSAVKELPQSERILEMTLFFNDDDGINGIPVEVPAVVFSDGTKGETRRFDEFTLEYTGEKLTYYMNGLRALISMFKLCPFMPITNSYINDILNIEAVALSGLTISTVPGYPRCISATIQLLEFNYHAYLNELPLTGDEDEETLSSTNMFEKCIDFESLRYYYQKPLYRGQKAAEHNFDSSEYLNLTYGNKTALQPMSFGDSSVEFYLPDSEHLDRLYQTKLEAISNPLRYKGTYIASDGAKEWASKVGQLYPIFKKFFESDEYREFADFVKYGPYSQYTDNNGLLKRLFNTNSNDSLIKHQSDLTRVYNGSTAFTIENFAEHNTYESYMSRDEEYNHTSNIFSNHSSLSSKYVVYQDNFFLRQYFNSSGYWWATEKTEDIIIWKYYYNNKQYYTPIGFSIDKMFYDIFNNYLEQYDYKNIYIDIVYSENIISTIDNISLGILSLIYNDLWYKDVQNLYGLKINISQNNILHSDVEEFIKNILSSSVDESTDDISMYFDESNNIVITSYFDKNKNICGMSSNSSGMAILEHCYFYYTLPDNTNTTSFELPTDTMLETVLSDKQSTDVDTNSSFRFIKYPNDSLLDNLIVTNISASLNNNLSRVYLKALDGFAPQYMGGQDVMINLTMTTTDELAVAAINLLPKMCSEYMRNYHLILSCVPLRINTQFTRMIGVNEVLIDSLDVTTVDKQPGLYEINMRLISTDRTVRNKEALKRLDVNNAGAKTNSNTSSYTVRDYFDLKNKISAAEVYPDLELPTIAELELYGFNFIKYKIYDTNRVYPDPDFYFVYSSVVANRLIRESILQGLDEEYNPDTENIKNKKFTIYDHIGGKADVSIETDSENSTFSLVVDNKNETTLEEDNILKEKIDTYIDESKNYLINNLKVDGKYDINDFVTIQNALANSYTGKMSIDDDIVCVLRKDGVYSVDYNDRSSYCGDLTYAIGSYIKNIVNSLNIDQAYDTTNVDNNALREKLVNTGKYDNESRIQTVTVEEYLGENEYHTSTKVTGYSKTTANIFFPDVMYNILYVINITKEHIGRDVFASISDAFTGNEEYSDGLNKENWQFNMFRTMGATSIPQMSPNLYDGTTGSVNKATGFGPFNISLYKSKYIYQNFYNTLVYLKNYIDCIPDEEYLKEFLTSSDSMCFLNPYMLNIQYNIYMANKLRSILTGALAKSVVMYANIKNNTVFSDSEYSIILSHGIDKKSLDLFIEWLRDEKSSSSLYYMKLNDNISDDSSVNQAIDRYIQSLSQLRSSPLYKYKMKLMYDVEYSQQEVFLNVYMYYLSLIIDKKVLVSQYEELAAILLSSASYDITINSLSNESPTNTTIDNLTESQLKYINDALSGTPFTVNKKGEIEWDDEKTDGEYNNEEYARIKEQVDALTESAEKMFNVAGGGIYADLAALQLGNLVITCALYVAGGFDSDFYSLLENRDYDSLNDLLHNSTLSILSSSGNACLYKFFLALCGRGVIDSIAQIGEERSLASEYSLSCINEICQVQEMNDPYTYTRDSFYDMITSDMRGRMCRAFPTFYLLFVDEGREIGLWKLNDNFYNMSSISEITVTKSRKIAADTCSIQMTNMFKTFTTDDEDGKEMAYDLETLQEIGNGFQDLWDSIFSPRKLFLKEYRERMAQNPVDRAQLKPGVRIHLRMGYGSDAYSLPCAFNGVVAQVTTGELVNIICQGDGVELTNPITENITSDDIKNMGIFPGIRAIANWISSGATPKTILSGFLTTKGTWMTNHINKVSNGRFFDDNYFGINHFGDPDFKDIFGGSECCQNIYEAQSGATFNTDHTYCTGLQGLYTTNQVPKVSTAILGKSYWDLMHVMAGVSPDYIASVTPFGLRSTVFYGLPHYYYAYEYMKDENGLIKEKRKPFQQYHIYSSFGDIIENNISTSSENMKTNAVGLYSTEGWLGSDSTKRVDPVFVDIDIYSEYQKSMTVDTTLIARGNSGISTLIPFYNNLIVENTGLYSRFGIDNEAVAFRITTNALKNAVKEMYQGELIVVGDPSVKPYDLLYLSDVYENMNGGCEVEAVVHTLSCQTGFTTSVYVDPMIDMDNRYYQAAHMLSIRTVGHAVGVWAATVLTSFLMGRNIIPLTTLASKMVSRGTRSVASGASKVLNLFRLDNDMTNKIKKTILSADFIGNTDASVLYSSIVKKINNLAGSTDEIKDLASLVRRTSSILEINDELADLYTLAQGTLNLDKIKDAKAIEQAKKLIEEIERASSENAKSIVSIKKQIANSASKISDDVFKNLDNSDEISSLLKILKSNTGNTDEYLKAADNLIDITKGIDKASNAAKAIDKLNDVASTAKDIAKAASLATKTDGIADALKAVTLAARGSHPIVLVVSAIAEFVIEAVIVGTVRNAINRWTRNLETLRIYPLKKNGKVYTAGLSGSRGIVVGSSTEYTQGWLQDEIEKIVDSTAFKFIGNTFLGDVTDIENSVERFRRNNGLLEPDSDIEYARQKIIGYISSVYENTNLYNGTIDSRLALDRINTLYANENSSQEDIDIASQVYSNLRISDNLLGELSYNNDKLNGLVSLVDCNSWLKCSHYYKDNSKNKIDISTINGTETLPYLEYTSTDGNVYADIPLLCFELTDIIFKKCVFERKVYTFKNGEQQEVTPFIYVINALVPGANSWLSTGYSCNFIVPYLSDDEVESVFDSVPTGLSGRKLFELSKVIDSNGDYLTAEYKTFTDSTIDLDKFDSNTDTYAVWNITVYPASNVQNNLIVSIDN